eukprot:5106803-Alexandrium_andersonii.AAC.1
MSGKADWGSTRSSFSNPHAGSALSRTRPRAPPDFRSLYRKAEAMEDNELASAMWTATSHAAHAAS